MTSDRSGPSIGDPEREVRPHPVRWESALARAADAASRLDSPALGAIGRALRRELEAAVQRDPLEGDPLLGLAELAIWEGANDHAARTLRSARCLGIRGPRADLLEAAISFAGGDHATTSGALSVIEAAEAALPAHLVPVLVRLRAEQTEGRLDAPAVAERWLSLGRDLSARARRERVLLGRGAAPPGFEAFIQAVGAELELWQGKSAALSLRGGLSPFLVLERVAALVESGRIEALRGRTLVMLPATGAHPRTGMELPASAVLLPSGPLPDPRDSQTSLSVDDLEQGSREGVVWASAAPYELLNYYGFEWLREASERASMLFAGSARVLLESILLRPALASVLHTIELGPPHVSEVSAELSRRSAELSAQYALELAREDAAVSAELADAYRPHLPLPWSALDLLARAAAVARHQRSPALDRGRLLEVASRSGRLGTDAACRPLAGDARQTVDRLRRANLPEDLANAIAAELSVNRAMPALRCHPDRPDLALLVLGTAASAKTSVAGALAHALLGSRAEPLRFDLASVSEEQALALLRADPPGQIASRLMVAPFQVIELASIEHASTTFLARLAEILSSGLIDSIWRPVRLRRSVFVMTATIGESFGNELGFQRDGRRVMELERLAADLFPRARRLLDTLMVVKLPKLQPEELRVLVEMQIRALVVVPVSERLGTRVEVERSAVDLVVRSIESWGLGVDRLPLAVQRLLMQPLARALDSRRDLPKLVLRADGDVIHASPE